MKLVHYFPFMRLELGGPVRACLDFCGCLAAAGHDVTLVTGDDSAVPDAWRDDDTAPTVVTVPPPTSASGRHDRAARRVIDEQLAGTDVVHLHGLWRLAVLQVGRAAERAGKPYLISLHGMLDDWPMSVKPLRKAAYLAMGGRRYLQRAGALHFACENERAESLARMPHPQAAVIPFPFDFAEYRDLPGPEPARTSLAIPDSDRPCILFLSRLHPVKGVELLIEAARLLRADGHDFDVVIAGPGDAVYAETLRDAVRAGGLDDCVRFVDIVAGREKRSLYEHADVFCLPSEHENFGLVWTEALACGTPVVTTRGVGPWRELEAGGGAVIADRTASGLAEALRSVLDDPNRDARGTRGREWVFEFLDTGRIVKEFESLYEHLVRPGQSPAAPQS